MPGARTEAFSDRIDLALKLAAVVHRTQTRKGTRVPYLIHPVHVARILEHHGYLEHVVIAGVLHDVLEDLTASDSKLQEDLRDTFRELANARTDEEGFREDVRRFIGGQFEGCVLTLVDGVTERKTQGGIPRGWRERKEEALAHLREAGRDNHDLAALKAADALHNVRSITQDLERDGLRMMSRFNAEPHDTVWYYAEVAKAVGDILPNELIAEELRAAVDALKDAVRRQCEATLEVVGRPESTAERVKTS